ILCILLVAGHSTQTGVPHALLSRIGENKILDSWWETQQLCSEVYLVTNHYECWATANNFPMENVANDVSATLEELAIYYEQEEGEKSSSRGIVGVCSETHWITRFLEKSQEGVTALRLASVVFYCLYKATLPYLSDFIILQPQAQTGPSAGSGSVRTVKTLATNTALTNNHHILLDFCTFFGIIFSISNSLCVNNYILFFITFYNILFFNSAIVSGTLKSLKFYNISESLRRITCYSGDLSKPIRAKTGSDEETDELFLTAGLQDRVVQVYEGLVYMDFSKQLMDEQGYGISNVQPSVLHFFSGEAEMVEAMKSFAELTDQDRFMVQMARQSGSAVKLPSSGGAVVGLYLDQGRLIRLILSHLKQNCILSFCVIVPYNPSGTIATNSQV
uniref:Uncharacterized protein n=1 Tax=Oncorhynchus mykiss TaxID=8022 RepID=A0A8K9UR85_ONCMY